jgi:hypothetical protein
LCASVVATGDKAVEVSPYDVIIQDEQGFVSGSRFISGTEEQEVSAPEFEDAHLAPGDEVSGLWFFAVIDDAQLAHIFWQPDSGPLVTIANVAS